MHREKVVDTRQQQMTTTATKNCPIYFPNDIGKMHLRSVASDW
jgi:hypothetical protein